MPNPNTGAVNPALEPELLPQKDAPELQSQSSISDKSAGDKYGNKDDKETEGGRENQEMTRKTRSSKNDPETGDATSARK